MDFMNKLAFNLGSIAATVCYGTATGMRATARVVNTGADHVHQVGDVCTEYAHSHTPVVQEDK